VEETIGSGQLHLVVEIMDTSFNVFGTTDGKIFRLDDPRNSAASATPANITPTVTDMSGLNIRILQ
jgi:hypothetical protein